MVAARDPEPIGFFGDHREAHVLEHREDGGERDGLSFGVDLEPEDVGRCLRRVVQVEGQTVALERRFDVVDVGHGFLFVEDVPVRGREGAAVPDEEGFARFQTVLGDEDVLETILPGPSHLGELVLEFC